MVNKDSLIVATPAQLAVIVRNAVRDELRNLRLDGPHHAPLTTGEFLSYGESAKFCGLSESTLRRAVKDGELRPANTNCRAVRFRKQDLAAWLESTT